MIQQKLTSAIQAALIELGVGKPTPVLEHPADISHGDYSTSAALAYSKELKVNPRELATKIVAILERDSAQKGGLSEAVEKIEIAGPGFINIRLKPQFFVNELSRILKEGEKFGKNKTLAGKKIVIDYTNPNPFKTFHIGHLMANAIGESISRLIEASGAHITRVNYQGDVGMHVAKAVWGMLQNEAAFPAKSATLEEMNTYISDAYVAGSAAFDDESQSESKEEITVINKMLFDRSNPKLMRIYQWGRKISLLNFEVIYKKLGTTFDKYFFESQTAGDGIIIVKDFLQRGVFAESEGAIVFKGEPYGLHTRVFITSQGLPTYEAKEIGLTRMKFEKFNPDLSIVVTASEQNDYFKVVLKALSIMFPYMVGKMLHINHGMLRFASGKMSSRKGNVITGESLLSDVAAIAREKMSGRDLVAAGINEKQLEQVITDVSVGAIKYSILKQALGSDIIYDFEKSISFEGDSGPYLQYSCVRARSILAKAKAAKIKPRVAKEISEITLLEKLLYRFPEVVVRATESHEPHHIATYLIELSAVFNSYYAATTIIDPADKVASAHRVAITDAFSVVMENGLNLLGIRVPIKM